MQLPWLKLLELAINEECHLYAHTQKVFWSFVPGLLEDLVLCSHVHFV